MSPTLKMLSERARTSEFLENLYSQNCSRDYHHMNQEFLTSRCVMKRLQICFIVNNAFTIKWYFNEINKSFIFTANLGGSPNVFFLERMNIAQFWDYFSWVLCDFILAQMPFSCVTLSRNMSKYICHQFLQ